MRENVQVVTVLHRVPWQRERRSFFQKERYGEILDAGILEEEEREEEGDLFSFYLRSIKGLSPLTKQEESESAKRLESGRRLIKGVLLGFPLTSESVGALIGKEGAGHWVAVRRLLWRRKVPDSYLVEEGENLLTWCREEMEKCYYKNKRQKRNGEKIRRKLEDLHKKIQRGKALLYQAREELILANLIHVVKLSQKFMGGGLSRLDLIQEGSIGLMKALERFDYRKGLRFSAYASWYIRREMLQVIARHIGIIRLPLPLIQTSYRDADALEKIHQKLRREPLDHLSSPTPLPDQECERRERERMVWNILNTLSPLETEIVRRRFGLGREREETLEEVGRALGFTRERIRQVEEKAFQGLRRPRRFALLKRLVA